MFCLCCAVGSSSVCCSVCFLYLYGCAFPQGRFSSLSFKVWSAPATWDSSPSSMPIVQRSDLVIVSHNSCIVLSCVIFNLSCSLFVWSNSSTQSLRPDIFFCLKDFLLHFLIESLNIFFTPTFVLAWVISASISLRDSVFKSRASSVSSEELQQPLLPSHLILSREVRNLLWLSFLLHSAGLLCVLSTELQTPSRF